MSTNFNLQVSGIPYTHKIRVRFNPVVGVNQTKVLIYEVPPLTQYPQGSVNTTGRSKGTSHCLFMSSVLAISL